MIKKAYLINKILVRRCLKSLIFETLKLGIRVASQVPRSELKIKTTNRLPQFKQLFSILSLFVVTSSFANANYTSHQNFFTERLRISTDKLAHIENQLSAEDEKHMEYLIGHLEEILRNYNNPTADYICVSNGEGSAWEKFGVYSPLEGKVIGGYTSKSICHELVKKVNNSTICLSNGESASWEKFIPYDLIGKEFLGGATSLQNCYDLIVTSSRTLMCLSNGENTSWEKFTLYDRINKKFIGSQTSKENCLESLR